MGFTPALPESSLNFVFALCCALAFCAVVSYFLYENRQSRNIFVEILLSVLSACTLGTSLFFGLVKMDVVL